MDEFNIKVGDLVKLRYDLEDGGYYGGEVFLKSMKFKNFKKVKSIDTDIGEFSIDGTDSWYTKEMIAEVKRPCQYKTIYKREEPILDDKEKEYLSAVIKPFRKKVECISKCTVFDDEYICISISFESIQLPCFHKGKMYKNMKLHKNYTLEELGL